MPSHLWMTNESGIHLQAFRESARDLTQLERFDLGITRSLGTKQKRFYNAKK